jgi:glucose-6-phosphate isomerase
MLQVDLTRAKQFLSTEEYDEAYRRAEESFNSIRTRSGAGSEWLGWRDLLAQPNDAILERIDSLATTIRSDADVFIVCGIGGSYLGARAVIDALKPYNRIGDGPEIIYSGHHMSGRYLENVIRHLEAPNEDGSAKSVYLNVISKSGSTLETALAFRVLRSWIHEHFPEDASRRIICTTGAEGGVLNKLISEYGYGKFIIPDDVGGRFSVLTPVGLLPVSVAGVDIRTLFYEAVAAYEKLESNPVSVLEYAAVKYALAGKGKAIDVISSFEPELHSLGRWLQQLLGESEGKDGKGMFPATTVYSTDLHSLGQLIQDGRRNLMETFITVKRPHTQLVIKELEGNHDELNYLAGKSFHEINTRAFEGTLKAHAEGGVPSVVILLDNMNAQHVGEFIYFYELMTAVYCYCLGVNPFNQPGVEAYKKAMYELLGK